MEKVYLSKECKRIFNLIIDPNKNFVFTEEDEPALAILQEYGFIEVIRTTDGSAWVAKHTDRGFAYKAFNPKLKNPSILDDIKYLITTSIALLALINSVVALIKAW